ncbi:OLC1v1032360C1 [Oldenlandia corymbosa var. corymbosa]|uniref:OLC1v1032360C1 n=1 Tax=Oldenlandia corymbosa var. corymbosa TaxID=529605 RepID=A0AAV1CLI9_OLDCO|nr:OLC1v1032360C1 [Oldenlandia corymbosa var. corymbosa]
MPPLDCQHKLDGLGLNEVNKPMLTHADGLIQKPINGPMQAKPSCSLKLDVPIAKDPTILNFFLPPPWPNCSLVSTQTATLSNTKRSPSPIVDKSGSRRKLNCSMHSENEEFNNVELSKGKKMCRSPSDWVLFLIETRSSVPRLSKWMETSSFVHMEVVDPINTSGNRAGGLALFWSDDVHINVVVKTQNFVCCKVVELNGFEWLMVLVYGPPLVVDRPTIWQQLLATISPLEYHVLFAGDFNQVLSPSDNEQQMRLQLDQLLDFQDSYWRQRSHITWNLEGYRNTSLFHHWATRRQARNWVSDLRTPKGSWETSPLALCRMITDHFSSVYTQPEVYPPSPPGLGLQASQIDLNDLLQHLPTLSSDQLLQLQHPITEREIKPQNWYRRSSCATGSVSLSPYRLNFEKSSMAFSPNTPMHLQTFLRHIVHIDQNFQANKYLGMPLELSRNRGVIFSDILHKVQGKIATYKIESLSVVGRMVLARHVLSSLPQYAMGIFKLPESINHGINKQLARFIWQGDHDGYKIHWEAWSTVCKSRFHGGLVLNIVDDRLFYRPVRLGYHQACNLMEIWKDRNRQVLGDGDLPLPHLVVSSALSAFQEYQSIPSTIPFDPGGSESGCQALWSPSFPCLQVDGAFSPLQEVARASWVFSSPMGVILSSDSCAFLASSSLQAEDFACLVALDTVDSLAHPRLQLHTDCLVLAKIRHNHTNPLVEVAF